MLRKDEPFAALEYMRVLLATVWSVSMPATLFERLFSCVRDAVRKARPVSDSLSHEEDKFCAEKLPDDLPSVMAWLHEALGQCHVLSVV